MTVQCTNCRDWKHIYCIEQEGKEKYIQNQEDMYLCSSCRQIGKILRKDYQDIQIAPKNFLYHLLVFSFFESLDVEELKNVFGKFPNLMFIQKQSLYFKIYDNSLKLSYEK